MIEVIPEAIIEKMDSRGEIIAHIERAGRTAYKSEGNISQGSGEKFIKKIMKLGHESVIEHCSATVRVICDRGCSHEIVRHRIGSYTQECLSGDTMIHMFSPKYKPISIKDLYELQIKNGYSSAGVRRKSLMSCNDDHIICQNRLVEVFKKGLGIVYLVTTKGNYTIKTTENHEFMIESGFLKLSEIKIGDKVYMNKEKAFVYEKKVRLDEIVSIENVGEEEVYDISMMSPYHNYIANGFVVHNSTRYCNYSKGKFDNQISVVKPVFYVVESKDVQERYLVWKEAMEDAEKHYLKLLKLGATPQEARSVLPNSLKTEIVITMNFRSWRNFFNLRTANNAHPDIRVLAKIILEKFSNRVPEIFGDI